MFGSEYTVCLLWNGSPNQNNAKLNRNHPHTTHCGETFHKSDAAQWPHGQLQFRLSDAQTHQEVVEDPGHMCQVPPGASLTPSDVCQVPPGASLTPSDVPLRGFSSLPLPTAASPSADQSLALPVLSSQKSHHRRFLRGRSSLAFSKMLLGT